MLNILVPHGGSGSGSTSPLTTKGDVWGYSTVDARLAVGTDGQVLTADSASALGVKWGTAGSGTVTTVNTDATTSSILTNTANVIGTSTVTLALKTQAANIVLAGPTNGADAAPAFRALVAADVPNLAASKITSGTLAVAQGGTNLASGTSGGILGYTASGTLASSIALTASALILGGGAGATPTPMGSLGTTTTLLHGNAAGAPTFSAVSLIADVSGTLPIANGGTANTTAAAAYAALAPANTTFEYRGASGRGGTNTSVIQFTTATATTGAAVTAASDSTLGTAYTIVTADRYTINVGIGTTGSNSRVMITKNQATLNAFPPSDSEILLSHSCVTANNCYSLSVRDYLAANDVIRVVTGTSTTLVTANTADVYFRIVRG